MSFHSKNAISRFHECPPCRDDQSLKVQCRNSSQSSSNRYTCTYAYTHKYKLKKRQRNKRTLPNTHSHIHTHIQTLAFSLDTHTDTHEHTDSRRKSRFVVMNTFRRSPAGKTTTVNKVTSCNCHPSGKARVASINLTSHRHHAVSQHVFLARRYEPFAKANDSLVYA